MSTSKPSLDSILVDIGEFGKYQIFVFTLICISITLNSAVNILYVFTARDLQYRCYVLGCDSNESLIYNPEWLKNAVPFDADKPARCEKFVYNVSTVSNCTSDRFDQNLIRKCDSYVYETEDISIVKDFDVHCDDNVWKLTLIGTINNIGQFVGLPISGYLSDKYGRKIVLIVGMTLCTISGIIRSFTTTYVWFAIFEFLDATFAAGAYACGFILAVELVGPQKRVLSGTLLSSTYAVGEILTGVVAWLTHSWRPLIQILFAPAFLLVSYFWLTPESVRWLLSKGRTQEAIDILKTAAKINGKTISDESLNQLALLEEKQADQTKYPLLEVFRSRQLTLRFLNCCFCWITCAFLFYGLTLNSVALAGNPYLDFILTACVEIPAYFATIMLLDRIGRRISQSGSFFITGIACAAFIFIPTDAEWLRLSVYLIGKFGATTAFTVCYVLSSEIFPTPLRVSLMGVCSMIGRIGSMISPQMPLLVQIWEPLPLILFGLIAVLAGSLALLFPETVNTKLPDTIEEAENIGKTKTTA